MSSLAQRLLTAIVLIPVVVWVVLFSSDLVYTVVLGVIVFAGGYEWVALSGVHSVVRKISIAALTVVCAYSLTLLNGQLESLVISAGLVFWLLVVIFIITKPTVLLLLKLKQGLMILLGLVVLGLTFLSLHMIRINFHQGPELLMYLLLLIWVADSGAYFVGRAIGKHKLSPVISPGKSIEGVVGGLLACCIFAFFAADYLKVENTLVFLLLSVFIAFISVYGDLFESLMKRRAKVKDSGSILPGHGGVLDRIDSLIAAGPTFVACTSLTQVLS